MIRVITSCGAEKALTHPRQLTHGDFARGPGWVEQREKDLPRLPAWAMYTGPQHTRLMRGVSACAEAGLAVELWIVSAGYGLVRGTRELAPYDSGSWAGMKAKEKTAWAAELGLPGAFRALAALPEELTLLLLGDDYLAAVLGAGPPRLEGFLALCAGRWAGTLGGLGAVCVPLGNAEAKRAGVPLVGLKGEVAARMLQEVARGVPAAGLLLETDFRRFIDRPRAVAVARQECLRVPPPVTRSPCLPAYFLPDWDDLVDPGYDFARDRHSSGLPDWSNECYAHQLYGEPSCDGLLLSKVVADRGARKRRRLKEMGVRAYLRAPAGLPVLGDCGAFGYVKEDAPPYTTAEILEYYSGLGFDYGVSIDHLIVAATKAQARQRYELTLHNAEEFLKEHGRGGHAFTPVGCVQGYDESSYREGARRVLAMGYTHIAIGGLVRSTSREVLKVLRAVSDVLRPGAQVHLFGVARLKIARACRDLGVTSFDTASYLRQAWMRGTQGYMLGAQSYAALRIPEVGKSYRAKRMKAPEAALKRLERAALDGVRGFDQGRVGAQDCLKALLEYDLQMGTTRVDMTEHYRRTLEEAPWRRCPCKVCRDAGVEVIIFRGSNRNRRRGFHNSLVFYQGLRAVLAGEMAVPELAAPARQGSLFGGE